MIIKLNENAEKYFNEKIIDFLHELKPEKAQKQKTERAVCSASHSFITEHLTEKDIINLNSLGYTDSLTGRQVARYFFVDNVPIGLHEKAYTEFESFVDNLYRKKEINTLLSRSFLCDHIFNWFEGKYKGTISSEIALISFLKEKAAESIKKFKVSLPISFLSIEKPFKVGDVLFDYLTKDFCDTYINNAKTKANEQSSYDETKFNIFETRFRKKYQGAVSASLVIEAEQQRCIEIARHQIERALTVLRFFSPTALLPEIPCYFGIMGQTDLPQISFFVFEDGDKIPLVQESIDERRDHRWSISDNDLSELSKLGFGIASNLICKKDFSEFEDSVFNSMSLFVRALTSRGFQDKIVYILVSAETLLLQNQSEPIQSTVGLRLAFLAESKPKQRREIKESINNAYKIRSSYIHHGQAGEDWELLRQLQHIIWAAIINALVSVDKFKTRKELFDHLENMILS